MSTAIENFAGAAAAYGKALHAAAPGASLAGEKPDGPADTGFAAMVKSAIDGAIAAGEAGERLSMAALVDGADLTQVVTAVSEAETLLNTVIAVRDRVIEAYKDIMRMPI